MRNPALPGQRSDMSNIRKNKKCCKHPKSSFSRANIRCVKHPKNQNVVQTSENQLYQGKHPICQTSEKPKKAAIIRKPALPWQTSDMPNIRKTKKSCKHPKSSFSRANFRYVKHSKNQKVLQLCKNQLYQGNHPIFQTSEKPKSAANMRKSALRGQTSDTSNIQKLKSAANIRKAAFPGQTSDVSNIRKIKNCCKPAKTSLTRANILYVKHLKNQKVLQTSENQLYHGEHPICQISEKPKSAANIRKAAFPGQTSNMSDIRKTKKCCIHAKTSFTRAKIRYVKHPKKQKVLQTSENQLNQGKHQICRASEKPKSAANIQKPALPWQTSDMSNIRKPNKCCKKAKISLTRANIRYFEHPKNEKVMQISENQLNQGKHQICRTSEKPKSAANIQKPALPWQTSDMSNIRKTKKCCKKAKTSLTRANIRYFEHPKKQKCCKHPKSSFSRANIRYVRHPKNQKVLHTCENQLYEGKHPIRQTFKN